MSAEGNRIPAANYEKMVDRNTLIVPLTHVCFKNGFRSDVNAITQIAHRAGALVMLDDYQDCGTRPVDVKAHGSGLFCNRNPQISARSSWPGFHVRTQRAHFIAGSNSDRMVCASQSVCLRPANCSTYLPPREDSSQVLHPCPMCTRRCPDSNCCKRSVWRMWQATSRNSHNRY